MAALTPSIEQITTHLQAWNRRRRMRDLLIWVPRGLLGGLLVAVGIAALARFRPIFTNAEVGWIAAGCGLVGMLAGILWVLLRRESVHAQATFSDPAFGLNERLVTAIELHDGTIDAPEALKAQQLEDAVQWADQVDVDAHLPYEINGQDGSMIILALALLAAAVIFPNNQAATVQTARAVQQEIDEQIVNLEELREEILEDETLTETQQEEILNPIDEALSALEEGGLTQEEALAELSQAEAELRDLAQQNDNDALQERLTEAGSSLSGAPGSGDEAAEAMSEGDLAQTATELRNLAEELPGLTAEQQAEIGRELTEAAQAVEGVDPELAQELAEAGTSLQQGEVAEAQEALEAAAEQLDQAAGEQAVAEAAENAAGEVNEGRQEVAQAGQEQAGQQGQAGEQGEQAGQTGEQTGQQGQAGEQVGQQGQQGEAGGQQAGGQQGQTGGQQGTQPGGEGGGGGSSESVFVPPQRDLDGEGVDVELPAECQFDPASCGFLLEETPSEITDETSRTPYEEVYQEYADAASEALQEDYVPLGMKEVVRDYFTSLEPGEDN